MYIFLVLLLVLVSLALIGVVLIQSGKGNGLSGAFGTGEGQAVFGSRTGDVLTKATEIFAIAFMVLCIIVTVHGKVKTQSLVVGKGASARANQQVQPMKSIEEVEQLAIAATSNVEKVDHKVNTSNDVINLDNI